MNFFEMMFNVGPGIMAIFKYGIQPREEDFFELTHEQYRKLEEDGIDCPQKMYAWLSVKLTYETNEILVLSEEEKGYLFAADKLIDNYCKDSKEVFKNYDEKLRYVAKKLPSVFSEKTKYKKNKRDATSDR